MDVATQIWTLSVINLEESSKREQSDCLWLDILLYTKPMTLKRSYITLLWCPSCAKSAPRVQLNCSFMIQVRRWKCCSLRSKWSRFTFSVCRVHQSDPQFYFILANSTASLMKNLRGVWGSWATMKAPMPAIESTAAFLTPVTETLWPLLEVVSSTFSIANLLVSTSNPSHVVLSYF